MEKKIGFITRKIYLSYAQFLLRIIVAVVVNTVIF